MKIEQSFALEDHSVTPAQRTDKPLRVTASSEGTDWVWIEAEGHGDPGVRQNLIGIEFWNGRLRVCVWHEGEGSDPVVISLELLRAQHLGATVGREQGWDVFDCGGQWMVQRDDAREGGLPLIEDDEAIRLARAAGVLCNDDGVVSQGR